MPSLSSDIYSARPVHSYNALQLHPTIIPPSAGFPELSHVSHVSHTGEKSLMLKLLLFCVLLVTCWPLAIAALLLYPIIWLVLLPFRLVGIIVGGTFDFIAALFFLPGRVLRAI
jgi:hypothetical protein